MHLQTRYSEQEQEQQSQQEPEQAQEEINMGNPEKEIHVACQLFIYLSYGMLILVGYIRDFIDILFSYINSTESPILNKAKNGYTPIINSGESFYRRRLYTRCIDCFNRPVQGPASSHINVLAREIGTLKPIKTVDCLNLASYNYLGFGTPGHKICEKETINTINKYGISTCSSPLYIGHTNLHNKLENKMAKFLSVEDCMIFGMGWGTNCTAIPSMVGKGCLIISDSINHNSIVAGARSSGAKIKTFPHNNMKILEKIIRNSIIDGQPRTHRAWKKILIVVEGVYSMEGEMCDLPTIVELKKKYKCYLYLDEAHSIGAVGKHGRGVCEYQNVNPKDIDILMGTFTKSFGAIGGYIAGKYSLINSIRSVCASSIFSSGLSPVCCQQVLCALNIIDSIEGKDRIDKLVRNSNYVRKTLLDNGFHVVGSYGTAVVPFIVGHPAKCAAISRILFENGIACVIVGFPATPLLSSRVRLCISSAHEFEDLKNACDILNKLGDLCHLKYKIRAWG